MKAHPTLLQLKYDSVIETLSKRADVSLREALDIFYKSPIYEEMSQGISDMHCRSDGYLVEDIVTFKQHYDSSSKS
jgi:hypothetical protein